MNLTQKEAYLRPEMEVVLFGEDIITTSVPGDGNHEGPVAGENRPGAMASIWNDTGFYNEL